MINPSHLYLHLAQLICLLEKAEQKKYDTDRINKHLEEIKTVLYKLASCKIEAIDEYSLEIFRFLLHYFSNSLRYICESTIDDVSSEIFYGLRKAMEDWLPDSDSYIFVSSVGDFCFYYNLKTDDAYRIINDNFGFTPKYKLVFFNVPAHLKNDFASNTALYHELGHFIDLVHYHFSDTIYYKAKNGELSFDWTKHFEQKDIPIDSNKPMNHLHEYFADLFAAKYVGKSAYMYLDYIAKNDLSSETHPSTQSRIELIDEFVDNTGGDCAPLVDLFKSQVEELNCELTGNPSHIDMSSFFSNQCIDLKEKNDIHKMISSFWPLWNDHKHDFKDVTGKALTTFEAYKQISKLFEETIKKIT